jgi:hypothetical protein
VDYGKAIRFPFSGVSPWKNIALLAVCNLIPVIGPIVVLGYASQAAKLLVRDPGAAPPGFDFNRFTKYLERGVGPFLVQLVLTFVTIPVVWALMIGAMLLVAGSGGKGWAVAVAAVTAGLGFLMVVVVVGVATVPLVVRAFLVPSIGKVFDLGWCWDFVKRVFWTMLVSLILLPLIAFPIAIAGLLACYVGIFFVAGIITLIHVHIQVQLYLAYLDRGGAPLEIADDALPPAFPVLPGQPAPPA